MAFLLEEEQRNDHIPSPGNKKHVSPFNVRPRPHQPKLHGEVRGHSFDILEDPELAKQLYSCGSCEFLARDAVELTCPEHEEDMTMGIYCEQCILSYLREHNNCCPLKNHPNPTYEPSRMMRRKILSLKVFCPNSQAAIRQLSRSCCSWAMEYLRTHNRMFGSVTPFFLFAFALAPTRALSRTNVFFAPPQRHPFSRTLPARVLPKQSHQLTQ